MPVAAIQGDVILTNPATHVSACAATPPVPVVILLSLQQKVVFGIIPFAVTGSALTPHEYKPDSSCVPHTVLLGGLLTGPGSSKVFMGGFSANRLTDVADGDGLILGPGAVGRVFIGG